MTTDGGRGTELPETVAPLTPHAASAVSEPELGVSEPRRLPRSLAVVFWVLVGCLTATAAGVLTHRFDLHRAATAADQRLLIRVVGGGPVISVSGDPDAPTNPSALSVRMDVFLRNGGPRSERLVSAGVQQSGVVQSAPINALTLTPGRSVDVAVLLTLACDRVDLAERPDSILLRVRGADGRVAGQLLTFGVGHPTARVTGPSRRDAAIPDPTGPSLDYFSACAAGIQHLPLPAQYSGPFVAGAPSELKYQLRVEAQDEWAHLLVPPPASNATDLPGLRVTTDLDGPVRLDPGQYKNVTITTRVTDCAAAGAAISAVSLRAYLNEAEDGADLATEPADSRFQGTMAIRVSLSPGLGMSPAGFDRAFVAWLAGACPGL
jgi:hypothetical protein